jgi:hypothetical protein
MNNLSVEKQLRHYQFCKQIADIRDRNMLIEMLKDLHIKYLADQAMVSKIAKNEFMGGK